MPESNNEYDHVCTQGKYKPCWNMWKEQIQPPSRGRRGQILETQVSPILIPSSSMHCERLSSFSFLWSMPNTTDSCAAPFFSKWRIKAVSSNLLEKKHFCCYCPPFGSRRTYFWCQFIPILGVFRNSFLIPAKKKAIHFSIPYVCRATNFIFTA